MPGSTSPIQRGYLVLADISGYTSFLSQTELDHAQEILSDLPDIKPFEYFAIEQRPRGSAFSVRLTIQFVPLAGGGTRLLLTSRSYGAGVPRWLTRLISRYLVERAILRDWSFDRHDDLIAASA